MGRVEFGHLVGVDPVVRNAGSWWSANVDNSADADIRMPSWFVFGRQLGILDSVFGWRATTLDHLVGVDPVVRNAGSVKSRVVV